MKTIGAPTRPEQIREWVKREFAPQYVDRVVDDLVDVATGNRPGNRFEHDALERIFSDE